jgi:hypothetical protein
MVVVGALDQKPLIFEPLERGLSGHDDAGKLWMSGLGRPRADQPLPTLKLGVLCLHCILHLSIVAVRERDRDPHCGHLCHVLQSAYCGRPLGR